MKFLTRLFRAKSPAPVRDNDGKFLPHRLAVRRKAIDMARKMGRDDLLARLTYPEHAFTGANGQTAADALPFIQSNGL